MMGEEKEQGYETDRVRMGMEESKEDGRDWREEPGFSTKSEEMLIETGICIGVWGEALSYMKKGLLWILLLLSQLNS